MCLLGGVCLLREDTVTVDVAGRQVVTLGPTYRHQQKGNNMAKRETPWMTPEEVREYLGGISDTTLHRYRRKGLPAHNISERAVRYHRDEVDAWIREAGNEDR